MQLQPNGQEFRKVDFSIPGNRDPGAGQQGNFRKISSQHLRLFQLDLGFPNMGVPPNGPL